MNISRQIGWSNESNLLYQILKQLTKLTSVIFNLTPKYKVYTALLTQSGGGSVIGVSGEGGTVNIGTTYLINENPDNYDLTIYGAPNNDVGTYFVSNQTSILNYTDSLQLVYNGGAPVVKVLENTIGNIWFTYSNTGEYYCRSNDLFITDKTAIFGGYYYASLGLNVYYNLPTMTISEFLIITGDPNAANGYLQNTPIEIRVYN